MEPKENNIPIIYTNVVNLSYSGNDFLFEMAISNPNKVTNQVEVYMSPHHAKRLLYSLNEGIKSYEKLYGTINIDEPKTEKEGTD